MTQEEFLRDLFEEAEGMEFAEDRLMSPVIFCKPAMLKVTTSQHLAAWVAWEKLREDDPKINNN